MPSLSVETVTVAFGGLVAVDDVSFVAEPGRITGLIGPNGAGKTTMFNVITGLQAPTRGVVRLDGRDLTRVRAFERARLGLARTFQRLEVFGSLRVRENLLVAAEARKHSDALTLVDRILHRVGLAPLAEARADSLPTGTARLVELGRALATRPSVLLLDEPGSGLTDEETARFGDLLLELAAEGLAVLLVEHDVDLVMRVCADIHVLDFGRLIASGAPAEIQTNAAVQTAYLGAQVA